MKDFLKTTIEMFPPYVTTHIPGSCIATRLTVKLLVRLAFYLGIDRYIFDPCQNLIFLGMWVDSVERSFFVTEKRKQNISYLRS